MSKIEENIQERQKKRGNSGDVGLVSGTWNGCSYPNQMCLQAMINILATHEQVFGHLLPMRTLCPWFFIS